MAEPGSLAASHKHPCDDSSIIVVLSSKDCFNIYAIFVHSYNNYYYYYVKANVYRQLARVTMRFQYFSFFVQDSIFF